MLHVLWLDLIFSVENKFLNLLDTTLNKTDTMAIDLL